ncbi:segregation/condensation protein A [Alkalihalobacterium chitinilyticum]|uniref:Segregation and condensation protein A n=1 Tax=Alkalihalobacterium chitinilyticum TaxID=2980103 RepID=A0ABT5V992_9BACI|nr:segregation/condensation protein A [Alkalihalobacterium chitinilyticum]MDE5412027.1 segregation/condensation protein A [Alkalihalobacterium chitinilyticum]
MNSQYSVKLDAFEGPLDLLLHLINQAEVDIYDIPVAKITDQYMQYIRTMQELQLDIASEYLVMAATLLAIKSKMLLPKQQEEWDNDESIEFDEDDPREELMNRLIEYRKFKEAAMDLQDRQVERALIHTKPPVNLERYFPREERKEVTLKGITLFDMLDAYQSMLKRKKMQAPVAKTVKGQEYSIETRMGEIMEDLSRTGGKRSFYSLFAVGERSHIVISFLAVLELMKKNAIICEQENNFSDIMIYIKEEGSIH